MLNTRKKLITIFAATAFSVASPANTSFSQLVAETSTAETSPWKLQSHNKVDVAVHRDRLRQWALKNPDSYRKLEKRFMSATDDETLFLNRLSDDQEFKPIFGPRTKPGLELSLNFPGGSIGFDGDRLRQNHVEEQASILRNDRDFNRNTNAMAFLMVAEVDGRNIGKASDFLNYATQLRTQNPSLPNVETAATYVSNAPDAAHVFARLGIKTELFQEYLKGKMSAKKLLESSGITEQQVLNVYNTMITNVHNTIVEAPIAGATLEEQLQSSFSKYDIAIQEIEDQLNNEDLTPKKKEDLREAKQKLEEQKKAENISLRLEDHRENIDTAKNYVHAASSVASLLLSPELAKDVRKVEGTTIAALGLYDNAAQMLLNGTLTPQGIGNMANAASTIISLIKKTPSVEQTMLENQRKILENQRKILEKLEEISGKIDVLDVKVEELSAQLDQSTDQILDQFDKVTKILYSIQDDLTDQTNLMLELAEDIQISSVSTAVFTELEKPFKAKPDDDDIEDIHEVQDIIRLNVIQFFARNVAFTGGSKYLPSQLKTSEISKYINNNAALRYAASFEAVDWLNEYSNKVDMSKANTDGLKGLTHPVLAAAFLKDFIQLGFRIPADKNPFKKISDIGGEVTKLDRASKKLRDAAPLSKKVLDHHLDNLEELLRQRLERFTNEQVKDKPWQMEPWENKETNPYGILFLGVDDEESLKAIAAHDATDILNMNKAMGLVDDAIERNKSHGPPIDHSHHGIGRGPDPGKVDDASIIRHYYYMKPSQTALDKGLVSIDKMNTEYCYGLKIQVKQTRGFHATVPNVIKMDRDEHCGNVPESRDVFVNLAFKGLRHEHALLLDTWRQNTDYNIEQDNAIVNNVARAFFVFDTVMRNGYGDALTHPDFAKLGNAHAQIINAYTPFMQGILNPKSLTGITTAIETIKTLKELPVPSLDLDSNNKYSYGFYGLNAAKKSFTGRRMHGEVYQSLLGQNKPTVKKIDTSTSSPELIPQ